LRGKWTLWLKFKCPHTQLWEMWVAGFCFILTLDKPGSLMTSLGRSTCHKQKSLRFVSHTYSSAIWMQSTDLQGTTNTFGTYHKLKSSFCSTFPRICTFFFFSFLQCTNCIYNFNIRRRMRKIKLCCSGASIPLYSKICLY